MTAPRPEEIAQQAAKQAFGSPLVVNHLRGLVAEAIVNAALAPSWGWVSGDWAGWDFVHSSGTRLEVKQSAAKQTWRQAASSSARFDIAARTGRYEGNVWRAEPGRAAHIYVFAVHPRCDDEADHRDPLQWRFYVAPAHGLPEQKTIGMAVIASCVEPVGWSELFAAVEHVRLQLSQTYFTGR